MDNYSILKTGSLVKANSVLNGTTYDVDTTLTADLRIQPLLNTFKSNYSAQRIEQALNFILTQVAVPFSESSTYNLDDFVVYDGFLYQCILAVTTAGEWNPNNWQVQKIFDNNGYVKVDSGSATKNI